MRMKMLFAAALLAVVGCDEVETSKRPLDAYYRAGTQMDVTPTYNYRITHHLGNSDGETRVYLTDDWSWANDGWISFVDPRINRKVWLSGAIEVEAGPFQKSNNSEGMPR